MSNNARRLLLLGAALLLSGSYAFAASAQGPEPYSAADPVYARPMQQEPLIKTAPKQELSLGNADDVKGPAEGPEPYSAPTPEYKPMASEPLLQKTKTPAPKL